MRLSRFLFAYRNTQHGTTGVSPAELMSGHRPRSPMDLLKPDLQRKIDHHQQQRDPTKRLRTFNVQDAVFVKNLPPGSRPTWLSGVIQSRSGPLSFEIALTDVCVLRKHVDHICAHHSTASTDSESTEDDLGPVKPCTQTETIPPITSSETVPGESVEETPVPPPRRSTHVLKSPEKFGGYIKHWHRIIRRKECSDLS